MPEDIVGWPRTVEEDVRELLVRLSDEDKANIRDRSKAALSDLHFSLGLDIRNRFGLNSGNSELMESCARRRRPEESISYPPLHEDDASAVIIEALWDELRKPQ